MIRHCTMLLIGLLALSATLAARAADPSYSLAFSTYYGGSDWEHARDVIADAQGNVYMAGGTFSKDFPTTPDAYDRTYNGGNCDAFIVKFSPEGKRIWSTLLGGPNYDRIYGIELDPKGDIVVAGRAGPGFPTTPGVLQPEFKGTEPGGGLYGKQNAFIAKLTPDCKLLWATYIGVGSLCRDVAVDADGTICVPLPYPGQGPTPPAEWFANAFQKIPAGDTDCGLARVAPDGKRVIWATWLGGSGKECNAASVRIARNGEVYMFTNTQSADMPATPGAHDGTHNGGEDCYLGHFSADGARLLAGTYFGGSGVEWSVNTHNLALDAEGNACVSVVTQSPDFPTTPGAFSRERRGENDIVVARFSPTCALLGSTFVGGGQTENPDGIYVDDAGRVVCIGETKSDDFPVTPDAFQKKLGGKSDAVAMVLAPDLSRLVYSTFLGGPSADNGRSGCLGPGGAFYLTGASDGPGLPVRNAHQPNFGGGGGQYGNGDCILARFAPGK